MGLLRPASLILSTVAHGALLLAFLDFSSGRSLEQGTGNDLLRIEQGIALEGLTRLGEAPETIEAREVIDQQASVARPELEEIKAAEAKPDEPPPPKEIDVAERPPEDKPPPPDETPTAVKPPEVKDVITSPLGPMQEIVETTPPPPQPVEVRPPQPRQVATEQQVEEVAILEQKAAARGQEGGDASAFNAYQGVLSRHLEKFKIAQTVQRGQKLESGRILVRITLNKKGELVLHSVVQSSGSERLDKLALKSVERAVPWPVDEKFIPEEGLTLDIPFNYLVREAVR